MAKTEAVLPKGVTKRKDGRYMWRFQYDNQSYTGYEKTAKKAEKALRDKRYEVEHGLFVKEKNITVDDWFHTWMVIYKIDSNKIKSSTAHEYEKDYKTYVMPVFGKRRIKTIRTEQLQKFLNDLAEKYSRSTVGNVNMIMYGMFDRAKKNHIISQNPMLDTELPKLEEPEKKKAITPEQQEQFFKYAASSPYYRLYKLSSLTGMRIGEVIGLQWEDIDYTKNMIYVRHSLEYVPGKGCILGTPKTKKSKRTIPILEETKILLQEQRKEQAQVHLKHAVIWKPLKGMENLVFTTKYGTPIYATNVSRDTRTIIKTMRNDGIVFDTKFTFHSLRHCFATRCVENGMDFKTLSTILGHATLAMTMDLYADCLPETQTAEMKKVASAL